MSEIKSPIKTVKRAAPIAMLLVSVICESLLHRTALGVLDLQTLSDSLSLPLPLSLSLFLSLSADMLVNIAFFAAVPKAVILSSNRLLAAEFMTRMFGSTAGGTAISVIIALSAIGNVLSVLFSQGRVNQELGREGILPFSKFFASNKPFNSPFAGLGLQWAVTLIMFVPSAPLVPNTY